MSSYWKHFSFFDKNGKNYNFEYDDELDMWTGDIFLPKISTGLFEVGQIFILQEFVDPNTNIKKYGFPHSYNQDSCNLNIYWETTDPQEISLFQYNKNFVTGTQTSLDLEIDGPPIQKNDIIKIELDYDQNQTLNDKDYIITDEITSEAVEVNFYINSNDENTYRRTLIINNECTGTTVAKFTVYGETVDEDERLKVMTQNFGYNIIAKDNTIFKNTDINEIFPDFKVINNKRKEIMIEGHNVYSFIGSYKGLINAIKFFGYDNIKIKEFWRNVDSNSVNFGKYIQSSPIDVLNPTVEFNDKKISLPNKKFKKTNLFSLIYNINEIRDGFFNEFDLPLINETSDFTVEEILIKLFALKRKLENEFLPLNARIKDIVGEGDYFGLQELTNTISKNNTNILDIGVNPEFCVEPGGCVYLQDLRSFELECLVEGATVGEAIIEFCNAFIEPFHTDSSVILGPYEMGDSLPKPPIGPDTNSVLGSISNGDDVTISDIADRFLSTYSRYSPDIITTEYIDGKSSIQLPDKPDIPIGAPVVLKNCSFGNITYDNVNSTWEQLNNGGVYYNVDFKPISPSKGDTYKIYEPLTEVSFSQTVVIGDSIKDIRDSIFDQLQDLKNNLVSPWYLYKIEKTEEECTTVGGVTTCENYNIRIYGDTPNRLEASVIPDPNFSVGKFQKLVLPGSTLYTWNSILKGSFQEIEWTVYKDEDDISPEYYFTVRGDINEYDRLPMILPYVGNYTVEIKLFDMYNNISSNVDLEGICVENREVEFAGWYQSRKEEYTWEADGKYTWNNYGSYWNLPINPSVTWEEETVKLYESLDRVNAILNNFGLGSSPDFQIFNFQNTGKASFSGPYQWENMNVGNWNDTYHLWWDMTSTTGDTPAFFEFKEFYPNTYLRITDLSGDVGEFWFDPNYLKLSDVAYHLNLSDDPIINKYIYNIVYDSILNEKYIQAVSRYFGVYGDILEVDIVDFDGNRYCKNLNTGECDSLIYTQGNHIASNPTWNTAKFVNEGKTLPRYTWIMFVYDNCKIFGKDKPRWTIKNISDPNILDIYIESRYLTYLFKHTGKYKILLELTDSNGNKYKKERNILVIK